MHRLTNSDLDLTSHVKMAAMTPLHAEKCCHLVSEHEASAQCICSSVRQFLIYSTCYHTAMIEL